MVLPNSDVIGYVSARESGDPSPGEFMGADRERFEGGSGVEDAIWEIRRSWRDEGAMFNGFLSPFLILEEAWDNSGMIRGWEKHEPQRNLY